MHPGRARCGFWPGGSKDQERPAHMAMPLRSYLQRVASTRVSVLLPSHRFTGFRLPRLLRRRRPLRHVHLARYFQRRRCSASCCLHQEEFQSAVARPPVPSTVAIASRQQTQQTPCYRNALIKTRVKREGKQYESDDHKHLIYKPKTPPNHVIISC